MAVYRLELAYDGSGFHGYARQDGRRTIQGELEAALSTYLKSEVKTAVAGRTDAGVHALGQVVSFELEDDIDLVRLQRSVGGILGPEISVRSARLADSGFHARFSATWRRYRYSMDVGDSANPLIRNVAWHVGGRLDHEAMRLAALAFQGEHDFSAFCRSTTGKSNVRRVTDLRLEREGESLLVWAEANAFCHQMVRSIVGYLYDVGRGFSDGSLASKVIADRDRSVLSTIAPARGLTLWAVGYES